MTGEHACRFAAVKDGKAVQFFRDLLTAVNTLLNYRVVLNPDMDQLQTQVGSPPATVRSVALGDSEIRYRRCAPLFADAFSSVS